MSAELGDPVEARPGPARWAARHELLGVLLFFVGLYGLTFHGYLDCEDTGVVHASASNLLDHGSLAVGDGPIAREVVRARYYVVQDGAGGDWYPIYPSLQILLHVPWLWLGRQLAFVADSRPEDVARLCFAAVGVFAGAACAVLMLLLGRRLGYRPRTAVVTALFGGTGTLLWCYAQGTLIDLPLAVLTTAAVWCLVSAPMPAASTAPAAAPEIGSARVARRGRAIGLLLLAGTLHGLACQLRPAALLLLLPIALFLRPWRRRGLLAFALPVVAVQLACVWLDRAVLLRPDAAGYFHYAADHPPALTYSYGLSAFGLLGSDGYGLFVLSPLLVLAILTYPKFFSERRRVAELFAGYLAVLVAFFAAFVGWPGGFWGPRYLMPAVPLVAVLVGHWLERPGLWRKGLTVVLAAASVAIQVLSIAVPFRIYKVVAGSSGVELGQFCYDPRFSPVLAHARVLQHKLAGEPDHYSPRQLFGIDGPLGERVLDVTALPLPELDRYSAGFQHFAWVRVATKGHTAAAALGAFACVVLTGLGLWRALRPPRDPGQGRAATTVT